MKFKEMILKYRIFCALTTCILIACCHNISFAAGGPGPGPSIYSAALDNPAFPSDTVDAQLKKLSAGAWLMIDANTGTILSSKNPDKIMYPASMTKMMTCILACESGRLNEVVTISAEAAATPYGNVKKGEKYILHDLLYRVMLPSDNGAAHAVGEFLGNDSITFTMMMNAKAKALHMNNTHFVNAHGLPDDDHYSTASDMMRLMKYCLKNRTFAEIVSNQTRDIKTLAGTPIHLKNTNKLFGRYEGCIGVKTGTTRAAGGCLASAVVRNGMKIYLVIMKCEPARERTDESIVLYNKGFEMIKMLSKNPDYNKKKKGHASKKSMGGSTQGTGVPVRRPKGDMMHYDDMMRTQGDVPMKHRN